MIVELFGPPGAGKTTFAKGLAAQLRASGRQVDIRLSSRPGEADASQASGAMPAPSLLRNLGRLTRPLSELAAISLHHRAKASWAASASLLDLLPPGRPFARLRMKQYLLRLAAAWDQTRGPGQIVIFDQAYLQVVLSILASRPQTSMDEVRAAVAIAPKSDFALRVMAPRSELVNRLDRRLRNLGGVGRWLESREGAADDYARLAEFEQDALILAGRPVLSVRSLEDGTFDGEIKRAERQIAELLKAEGETPCIRQSVDPPRLCAHV